MDSGKTPFSVVVHHGSVCRRQNQCRTSGMGPVRPAFRSRRRLSHNVPPSRSSFSTNKDDYLNLADRQITRILSSGCGFPKDGSKMSAETLPRLHRSFPGVSSHRSAWPKDRTMNSRSVSRLINTVGLIFTFYGFGALSAISGDSLTTSTAISILLFGAIATVAGGILDWREQRKSTAGHSGTGPHDRERSSTLPHD